MNVREQDSIGVAVNSIMPTQRVRAGSVAIMATGKTYEVKMEMVDFLKVMVGHHHSNRMAGSTISMVGRIVTNRPEAVVCVTLEQPIETESPRNSIGDWSQRDQWAVVQISITALGDDGYVAVLEHHRLEHCGVREDNDLTHIAGRQVTLAEVFFGSAWTAWAQSEAGAAEQFILEAARGRNRRLRHGLGFVMGQGGACYAPHAQRRAAWKGILRELKLERIKIGSSRSRLEYTLPVRVAMALGYKPSSPPPEHWEGIHRQVRVIEPTVAVATATG